MYLKYVYNAEFVLRNINRDLKQNNLKMSKMTEQTSPIKN